VLFAIDKPMLWQITISGLLIAHLSSWVSMVLIWSIAASLSRGENQTRAAVAFVAALLYIVSPAGVFVSAPYTESPFAAMNLLGVRLFLLGRDRSARGRTMAAALYTISGGLASCLATLLRSNGVLSGIPYAWDAVARVLDLARRNRDPPQIMRLVSLGLGGALIACGMILPQYKAYCEYCTGLQMEDVRPWCHAYLPSIFTFVQSHYW
jgi:GPI mannosyltransferase 2